MTYGYESGTGRFRSLDWSAGGQTGNAVYGYLNNSDLIEQLTINNSLITTYSYEPNRNLKTQVKNEFNTQLISQYDYNYNSLGLRDHMDTSGSAFTGTPIEPTPETSTYNTNSLNQYTQITKDNGQQNTDTLTYDDDGNLASIASGSSTKSYKYNAENRLVSVEPATPIDGDKKVEFVYDYMGRRVQKKVYTYSTDSWLLTSDTLFLFDGWNMIQEIDGAGVVENSYVWGLVLSVSTQGAGGVGGLLSSIQDQESSSQLFLYDANGNVSQLIKAADGTIAAHYEYDPFGVLLKSYGTMKDANPIRFSTKYYDIETDLYYYGYRFYSTSLGRWINRDPLEEEGGFNLYVFVGNNPLSNIDPYGLINWGSLINSSLSLTIPLPWPPPTGMDFTITLQGSDIDLKKCCFDVSLSGTLSKGINLKKYLTIVNFPLILEVGLEAGGIITFCKDGNTWKAVDPIVFITLFGQASYGGSRTYSNQDWGGFKDSNFTGIHPPIKNKPGLFATAALKGTAAWNIETWTLNRARTGVFVTLQGGVSTGWAKWSYDVNNWRVYP